MAENNAVSGLKCLRMELGEPDSSGRRRPVPIEGDSINGVILPVGGGSVAIIGQRDEKLDAIQKNIVNSVT